MAKIWLNWLNMAKLRPSTPMVLLHDPENACSEHAVDGVGCAGWWCTGVVYRGGVPGVVYQGIPGEYYLATAPLKGLD